MQTCAESTGATQLLLLANKSKEILLLPLKPPLTSITTESPAPFLVAQIRVESLDVLFTDVIQLLGSVLSVPLLARAA